MEFAFTVQDHNQKPVANASVYLWARTEPSATQPTVYATDHEVSDAHGRVVFMDQAAKHRRSVAKAYPNEPNPEINFVTFGFIVTLPEPPAVVEQDTSTGHED